MTWKTLDEIMHEDWIKACKQLKTTSFHKNVTVKFCFQCLTLAILSGPPPVHSSHPVHTNKQQRSTWQAHSHLGRKISLFV
jgi:hypothetical protein